MYENMSENQTNSNEAFANANPYINTNIAPNTTGQNIQDLIFGTTTNERFFRGVLIGGVAAYLLTNEKAQKTIIKGGMKLYSSVVGGVEEFKEKVMDAKAEMDEETSSSKA